MKKILLIFITFFLISSENELIVPFESMSEISYTGSHPAHDWTGTSSSFKGGIVCDSFDDCMIKIQIPINSFDSGNSSRDSNMLYYVEANKFKYVTFFSEPFSINDETLSIGNKFNIEGVIDFHGIERSVFLNVSIFPRDKYLIGTTEFKISLSDHSVDRPSLLFVPISNNILIKCNLFCELSSFKNYVQK